uniref:DUF4817 domain-containing protein n=1 Tax=Ciona savignyi TaxID=51511 RepID=H2Z2Y6_CIOSA
RPQWELKERIYCVKFYYKTGSFKKTQDSFMRQYSAPSKSRIQNWVDHFEKYGTVENLNAASENHPSNSGRPKKRTAELIESVRESLQQSPKRSVRKQSLGMSRETCRRVLVNDIRAYPYRIQTLQTLTVSDKRQRKAMAVKMLDKIEETPSLLNLLWTSDEAHFHLDGKANSKTNVFWGSSRPNEVATKPLHSPKCTVWAAISARGIIGPIFIEETGAAVTVTKERYVKVLKTFKSELQTLYPSLMSKFWFQQDGASSHTSNLSRDWLKENFGGRVISLKTNFEWAPHSPDLSPPDFFWGYLKDRVYAEKPRTITELKEAIREEMRAITKSVCKNVMDNFVLRLKKCTELNGGHLEHML